MRNHHTQNCTSDWNGVPDGLLVQSLPLGIVFQNRRGEITAANPAAERILGLTLEEMRAQALPRSGHGGERRDGIAPFLDEDNPPLKALGTGQPIRDVVLEIFNPRQQCWSRIKIDAIPIADAEGGEPRGVYSILEDVTAREPAGDKPLTMAESGRCLMTILDNLFAHVALLDPQGVVQEINQMPLDRGHDRREDVIGRYLYDTRWWSHDPQVRRQLRDAVARASRGETVRYDVEVFMEGELTPIDFQISPMSDARGNIEALLATGLDITKRRRAEEHIRYMAQHDNLTGLPNRGVFSFLLERLIAASKREHQRFALIFIDLDRFKPINDTHGHAVGDRVLQEVALRISRVLRESDTVARIGGDEFVAILANIVHEGNVLMVAEKIRCAVNQPLSIEHLDLAISSSMGIALYPEHGQDEIELTRNADQAMYLSKRIGRDRITVYVPGISEPLSPEVSAAASPAGQAGIQPCDLQGALDAEEFVYYYQPKVCLETGKSCGVEALIRWIRPDGNIIPPGDFIPLAEKTGFIRQISQRMFPKLATDLVIIQDLNPELTLSFNLTEQELHAGTILGVIRESIARYHLDPESLQIEVTESTLVNCSSSARQHIYELTEMGISLAMDDFGKGYASIEVLSQWPFSVIKIDQGLIRRMETSEKCTTIVKASIQLAHQMRIKVVAEGIEDSRIYDFLMNIGCSEIQGYWTGRPMPLAELIEYIRQDYRWSSLPTGFIHLAQLDHIEWRRTLIDYAYNLAYRQRPDRGVKERGPELDPKHCGLGQWYYGNGREFRGHPLYDAVEKPHDDLHVLGRELIALAQADGSTARLTEQVRRFTEKSGEVIALLQALENQSLAARLQSRGADG